MHTSSLFCLSLSPFKVTLFLALFLMLPICDLINWTSFNQIAVILPWLACRYPVLLFRFKVWAFHKNDILVVLNVAKVVFVPHFAKKRFAL